MAHQQAAGFALSTYVGQQQPHPVFDVVVLHAQVSESRTIFVFTLFYHPQSHSQPVSNTAAALDEIRAKIEATKAMIVEQRQHHHALEQSVALQSHVPANVAPTDVRLDEALSKVAQPVAAVWATGARKQPQPSVTATSPVLSEVPIVVPVLAKVVKSTAPPVAAVPLVAPWSQVRPEKASLVDIQHSAEVHLHTYSVDC